MSTSVILPEETPMSFLGQSNTSFSPPGRMVLMLLTAVLSVWLQANTKVTFTQSSSAKWAHCTTLSSTLPSLCIHSTHFLPCPTFVSVLWVKANELLVSSEAIKPRSSPSFYQLSLVRLSTCGETTIPYSSNCSNYTSEKYIIKILHSNDAEWPLAMSTVLLHNWIIITHLLMCKQCFGVVGWYGATFGYIFYSLML